MAPQQNAAEQNGFADGGRVLPPRFQYTERNNEMKLSTNAKEWIMQSVKNAFAEDLKKANEAVETEKNQRKELFRSFRAEVDKVLAEAKKEVEKIVKRMKLTFHDNKCIHHLDVFDDDDYYGKIDTNTFEETRLSLSKKMQELQNHVDEIKANIRTAVSKALFEIEVHGEKDSLAAIVDQVIKEIKEGK